MELHAYFTVKGEMSGPYFKPRAKTEGSMPIPEAATPEEYENARATKKM
jgi:hypothetical protein